MSNYSNQLKNGAAFAKRLLDGIHAENESVPRGDIAMAGLLISNGILEQTQAPDEIRATLMMIAYHVFFKHRGDPENCGQCVIFGERARVLLKTCPP